MQAPVAQRVVCQPHNQGPGNAAQTTHGVIKPKGRRALHKKVRNYVRAGNGTHKGVSHAHQNTAQKIRGRCNGSVQGKKPGRQQTQPHKQGFGDPPVFNGNGWQVTTDPACHRQKGEAQPCCGPGPFHFAYHKWDHNPE